MLVKDLMAANPELIHPDATLSDAAKKMAAVNCGVLPVGNDSQLAGIITDRDIVVRAIAKGKDPATEKVADYMTRGIHTCRENDSVTEAADVMKDAKVCRLVVMSPNNRVSGILTLGRILRKEPDTNHIAQIVTTIASSKLHGAGARIQ